MSVKLRCQHKTKIFTPQWGHKVLVSSVNKTFHTLNFHVGECERLQVRCKGFTFNIAPKLPAPSPPQLPPVNSDSFQLEIYIFIFIYLFMLKLHQKLQNTLQKSSQQLALMLSQGLWMFFFYVIMNIFIYLQKLNIFKVPYINCLMVVSYHNQGL